MRWDASNEHPPVTGVLVPVRGAIAVVQQGDVALSQTEVRLRSDARMVWRPVWGDDDVALARDVLDRRLVDTSGVQAARRRRLSPQRAAGLELAGIDVGVGPSADGSLPSAGRPPPIRVIDWAQLQAFVPGSRTQPRPGIPHRRSRAAPQGVICS